MEKEKGKSGCAAPGNYFYLDYSFGQNYPIIQDCARGDYSWQFVESRSVKKSYKCNLLASRKSERQRKGTMSPSTCSG